MTVVEYHYPNNDTQIQILNNEIDDVLTGIFNNTSALTTIGQAFGNAAVDFNGIQLQPTIIKSEWRYFLDARM